MTITDKERGMDRKCPAQTWFTKGHRYEARYSLTACKSLSDIFGNLQAEYSGAISHLLEKSRSKTYVHDVCVRCGDVVSRAEGSAP